MTELFVFVIEKILGWSFQKKSRLIAITFFVQASRLFAKLLDIRTPEAISQVPFSQASEW